MNHFTIRDIENLCNIKAHTLRIWEKRYRVFIPKRKESRHRIYSNDDLKELLRISFLYHQGYKISKIASLSCEERRQIVAGTAMQEDNPELAINKLIDASIDLDKERFEKIVNSLVLRSGLDKCIIDVFYPFLERIGLLWLTNNVIPAHEHFSSHIIRKKIICATDGIEKKPESSSHIAVFAPAGEFHEIPLLTANYFLRKNGNSTSYFGIDVSLDTLKYYAAHHPCTHFYAHVITNLCHDGLSEFMQALCRSYPAKKIILSGPACHCLQAKFPNLTILSSLQELIDVSKKGI